MLWQEHPSGRATTPRGNPAGGATHAGWTGALGVQPRCGDSAPFRGPSRQRRAAGWGEQNPWKGRVKNVSIHLQKNENGLAGKGL